MFAAAKKLFFVVVFLCVGQVWASEGKKLKRTPTLGDETSLETLMTRVRQEDMDAFIQMERRIGQGLLSFCEIAMGSLFDGAELSQEVLLLIYNNRHKFEEGRLFLPWMHALTRNKRTDLLRKAFKERRRGGRASTPLEALGETPDPASDPQSLMEAEEDLERMKTAVAELPGIYRDVINLHYYQGLKLREISEVTGVCLSTVKTRLRTALSKLGAAFQ